MYLIVVGSESSYLFRSWVPRLRATYMPRLEFHRTVPYRIARGKSHHIRFPSIGTSTP